MTFYLILLCLILKTAPNLGMEAPSRFSVSQLENTLEEENLQQGSPAYLLRQAIFHGERSIACRVAPHTDQKEKNLMLLETIYCGLLPNAELAIQIGADVNAENASPLLVALVQNHLPIADLLVNNGAIVPSQITVERPFYPSVPRGIIDLMLSSIPDRVGKFRAIKWLLEHSANPNDRGTMGYAPLHEVKEIEIAQLLCAHGADPNMVSTNAPTPLYLNAAATGPISLPIFILLVLYGADVNYLNPHTGLSILSVIAQRGHTVLVAYLLNKGARKDIKTKGKIPLELVKNNLDLYAMLASDELPPIPEEVLQVERELPKLKVKIA